MLEARNRTKRWCEVNPLLVPGRESPKNQFINEQALRAFSRHWSGDTQSYKAKSQENRRQVNIY